MWVHNAPYARTFDIRLSFPPPTLIESLGTRLDHDVIGTFICQSYSYFFATLNATSRTVSATASIAGTAVKLD